MTNNALQKLEVVACSTQLTVYTFIRRGCSLSIRGQPKINGVKMQSWVVSASLDCSCYYLLEMTPIKDTYTVPLDVSIAIHML
jgi:hypothetical protein